MKILGDVYYSAIAYFYPKIKSKFLINSEVQVNQKNINSALVHYLSTKMEPTEISAAINEGLCFGHSVSLSEMFRQKHLEWWLKILTGIVKSYEHLTNQNFLQQKATDWIGETKYTHEQLIERVINYVVFGQSSSKILTLLGMSDAKISHTAYLKSVDKYQAYLKFESSSEGNIYRITNDAVIAGYFNAKQLSCLLAPKDIQDNITVICSLKHACAILYDTTSQKFGFYDPNYSSGYPKWFDHKDELADEIIRRLGNAISLFTSSNNTEQNLAEQYEYEIKSPQYCLQRLQGKGLDIMHRDMPFNEFSSIVKTALQIDDVDGVLGDALMQESDIYGSTMAKLLRFERDPLLTEILQHTQFNSEWLRKFESCLFAKCENGCNGFFYIMKYSNGVFDWLLERLQHKDIALATIVNLLKEPIANVQSYWQYYQSHPTLHTKLEQLTKLISKDEAQLKRIMAGSKHNSPVNEEPESTLEFACCN